MAKIYQNDEKIVINFSPKMARFIGFVFLFAGCLVSLKQYIPYQLHCAEKSPGIAKHCLLYQTFFKSVQGEESFQTLKKAKVLSINRGKVFNLRLYVDNRTIKLTGFNVNERKTIKSAVDAINNYIKTSSETRFTIPKTSTLTSQIIFWFIIPFSLVFLGRATSRKLIIDKETKTVSVIETGWLKNRKEIAKHPYDDIKEYVLHSNYNQSTGTTYLISMALKNGETIDVESVSTNFSSHRKKIIDQLNNELISKA